MGLAPPNKPPAGAPAGVEEAPAVDRRGGCPAGVVDGPAKLLRLRSGVEGAIESSESGTRNMVERRGLSYALRNATSFVLRAIEWKVSQCT